MIRKLRIHNRQKIISSINDAGKTGYSLVKNKTRLVSYTTHINELKWIEGLNVRPETIKLLVENIVSKL